MTIVGTSRAVRLALVLKMFLLYNVVEAVYFLMKKVQDKFVSSVMTPARGGKISLSMLVKRKFQMCLAASYSSAVSGSSFLLLVIFVPKPTTQRSRATSSRWRWRCCCSQTVFLRGVYQWIHVDILPFLVWDSNLQNLSHSPAAHGNCCRIFLSS